MEFPNDPRIEELNPNLKHEFIRLAAVSFLGGILIGIVIASFLHKYIVHPFGW